MSRLLGGMPPSVFLREHWQKKPLLVRQALPGFCGLVDRDALLSLTTRADVSSRLVIDHGRGRDRWERHDGPFGGLDAAMLPPERWTVLVHGLESLVEGAWALLRRFDFIPTARVDDLMVSYAATGGSVGPHDDRYDVFLLQGPGRRRWELSRGGDRAHDPRAAIKVLAHFQAEESWVLEPGDMLYLPPGVAHHGVAEEPCFTYSIGFLAPSHLELVQGFLGYLGNVLPVDGDALYADPDLKAPRDPFALGDAMVERVAGILDGIQWDRRLVEDFLGCFLTRPKPRVQLTPPSRPLGLTAFARRLRARGRLHLALPTRGLVRGRRLFLDGEAHALSPAAHRALAALVRDRALNLPVKLDDEVVETLHGWYLRGSIRLGA